MCFNPIKKNTLLQGKLTDLSIDFVFAWGKMWGNDVSLFGLPYLRSTNDTTHTQWNQFISQLPNLISPHLFHTKLLVLCWLREERKGKLTLCYVYLNFCNASLRWIEPHCATRQHTFNTITSYGTCYLYSTVKERCCFIADRKTSYKQGFDHRLHS